MAGISEILSANFTKTQGLAFIFAISFNMSCVSALAATARETHSVRWTAKIGVFYTAAALLVSCIVYHIGLLVFLCLHHRKSWLPDSLQKNKYMLYLELEMTNRT